MSGRDPCGNGSLPRPCRPRIEVGASVPVSVAGRAGHGRSLANPAYATRIDRKSNPERREQRCPRGDTISPPDTRVNPETTMDPSPRLPAFPGTFPDSFAGTMPEMVALACAAGIRSSMEDHHAGIHAAPDARVAWPGGSCRYADAARLSSWRLQSFTSAANRKIAQDLHRGSTPMATWPPEGYRNFTRALAGAKRWYLPRKDTGLVNELAGTLRSNLPPAALRKEARDVQALYGTVSGHPAYTAPLEQSAKGNPGPAQAFDRGQQVTVETDKGPRPWAQISHMSNTDMMAFNIQMADYVLSAHEAMETVAFERPARRTPRSRCR